MIPCLKFEILKNHTPSGDAYLPTQYKGLSPPKCDGIITNCDSLVYYKLRWTVITNCDSFFITKCDGFITNCDRYYKVRWLLKIINYDSATTNIPVFIEQRNNTIQYFIQGIKTKVTKHLSKGDT